MQPLIRHLNDLSSIPKSHVSLLTSPFGFKISNLALAGDCLLFAKAPTKRARNILGMLDKFAKVCGQQINFHKSSLCFSQGFGIKS